MPFIRKTDWTPEKIENLIQQGKSLVEIGELFSISKQRVKQICKKHNLSNTVEMGRQRKAKKYFDKWGEERLDSDLYQACRDKFRRKKSQVGPTWAITFGELTWPETCPILGMELDYFAEKTQENSPSFDRIDSNKGYVTGNVQIISWRANRIKNDGTAEEHEKIAQYLRNLQEN